MCKAIVLTLYYVPRPGQPDYGAQHDLCFLLNILPSPNRVCGVAVSPGPKVALVTAGDTCSFPRKHHTEGRAESPFRTFQKLTHPLCKHMLKTIPTVSNGYSPCGQNRAKMEPGSLAARQVLTQGVLCSPPTFSEFSREMHHKDKGSDTLKTIY